MDIHATNNPPTTDLTSNRLIVTMLALGQIVVLTLQLEQ